MSRRNPKAHSSRDYLIILMSDRDFSRARVWRRMAAWFPEERLPGRSPSDIDPDVPVLDFRREGLRVPDPIRLRVRFARPDVVSALVPGADELVAVQGALAERSAHVCADPIQGEEAPGPMDDRDRATVDNRRGDASLRNVGCLDRFREGHRGV